MHILRLSTLSLTVAIAVFALGYVDSAFAAKPSCPGHPSCKDDDSSGGGDGDGTIPVMVTFRDVLGDRVISDGDGPYIDGVHKVSTAIGHEGSFYLKRSRGNQEAKRKLTLDFRMCDSACTPPPCSDACTALRGKVGSGGSTGINLSAMTEGQMGFMSLFITMQLGAENGGFFTLYFDTDSSLSDCASADALVTRTSADTWEIVGQTACLEELDGNVFRGNYDMPFQMTVQAL